MKFIDEAIIHIESGSGGAGSINFRRQKFIPRGGPDGGDGGKGGDIIFVADHSLSTLLDFQYKKNFKARSGDPGQRQLKSGSDATDLIIRVPQGTLFRDQKTGELLADLSQHEQSFTAAKGGRGGKGNHFFKNSINQAPRKAQPGERSQIKDILLELKLLCDVGIIGLPNAGKSTLLSRISNSKPKIANYPFTTLTPNLGVVRVEEKKSFVVADMPGLILGAHQGIGLGIKFLKHIERSKLFLHLIDISDSSDPLARFKQINEELRLYNPRLLKKNQIVILSKIDTLQNTKKIIGYIKQFKEQGFKTLAISAASGEGIKELIYTTHEELARS
ncbi:MAG: GTPase ObgE [Deltaproteobacteria bacterium GWA2_38_16]|nr:MAG: GTPase ObgE [Deltaproteobacteria bacterium GWA2_38_16]OGQ03356.1 MAG: GTPase ObgE [Deltaproteobacteria bacterium RIFCSPHIGHO2_02_FULL_38_15]HBQ20627.1 GTPase ObgE [Deltaproteobacteria bacterium]